MRIPRGSSFNILLLKENLLKANLSSPENCFSCLLLLSMRLMGLQIIIPTTYKTFVMAT